MRFFSGTHKKILCWIITLTLLILGSFCIASTPVSAQTVVTDTLGLNQFEQSTALGGGDIRVTIARIINVFLSILGVVSVVIVIYAGGVILFAGGNEERVAQGKRILINATIGLIIIFSSWALTRFILEKLQQGTGTGLPSSFSTSTTRLQQQFDCTLNPTWCCAQNNFIVQSITPRSDAVQLNNTNIRVVFSRGVRTNPDQVLDIFRDNVRVDNEFSFAFTDGSNRVLEARYTAVSGCTGASCLPPADYLVRIDDARDTNGNVLQTDTPCGTFPREGRFTIRTNGQIDSVAPTLPQQIQIAGVAQLDQPLPIGRSHQISIPVIDNGGAGYVHIRIGPENGAADIVVYDGPSIARGSDAGSGNPYILQYPMMLGTNIRPLQRYIVTASVYDVDSNVTVATSSFVTVAAHCFNNVQDGNETGVDVGGSCLGIGACTANWQCLSGQCTQGQCLATPIIMRVDPWDGGAGNWVTIVGRFFGETDGQISFGHDQNRDGTVAGAEWIQATLAQCGGQDTWHDDWIIAAIPDDAQLPQGTTSSIRVVRADDPTQSDTTADARGPTPGPLNGLFVKNAVSRPGICRVESIATGATAGIPRTPVRVLGQGFAGAGTAAFGGITIPTTNWSASLINTAVPESLRSGLVGVNVVVAGESSNGFPFDVLPVGEDLNPVIDSISPTSIANASLVTLSGRGFGERTGRIFLTENATATCAPADLTDGTCIEANTTLSALCGDTWGPQQVIMQVQGIRTSTQYFIRLRNAAGFQTTESNDTAAAVSASTPVPGICRITPDQGPAPRSPLQLTGVNFLTPVTVHFWSVTAAQNPTNIAVWPVFTSGTQVVVAPGGTSLTTPIPITTQGETMQSGPVYVRTGGGISNAIRYTVSDCRQIPSDQQPNGYHCCQDGSYRPNNQTCPGQTRDAGYVWRFTTGRTPNLPFVIQECRSGYIPSPSPWVQWDDGRQACINAEIRVRFNLDMNDPSLQNGIRIYTCGSGPQPQCSNRVDVTSQFTIFPETQSVRIALSDPTATLLSNAWYHVELLTGVQSQHTEVVLGETRQFNEPLKRTRPCGDQTAYCFDFQTDDQRCRVAKAFIHPPRVTTNLLGMLQDPRYPLSFDDPFNAPNPLYLYLWGQADRACMTLNVDRLGWQWATADMTAATVAPAPSPGARPIYTDSRATAVALRDTGQPGVEIKASTSTITATSTLIVDLGDPRVVEYWPNCVESCTNANIGVQFNRQMITSTFVGALRIQECADALCSATTGPDIQYDMVPANPDQWNPMMIRVSPRASLAENRWYLVSIDSRVRGMTALGSQQPGNALTPFSWRFRTKATDGFCIAARVVVEPNPFTARRVDQKTKYQSIPFSSPNQCTSQGQDLNPWAYGWQWQTRDRTGALSSQVARVTQFQTIAAPKPFCTAACTPAGADVLRNATVPALCGNGVVDRGEDCDIAGSYLHTNGTTQPEQAGVTCTLTCKRPGSTVATCGNGRVNLEFGEECDQGPNPTGCSSTCRLTGSVQQDQADLTSRRSFCGDGLVDAASGESCDIATDADRNGVPDEIPDVTCSRTNCLRLGSRFVSQNWCTQNATAVIDAQGTQARQTPACRAAVSVCGNGIVEEGELCEVARQNPDGSGAIRLFGQAGTFPISNIDRCTTSCLLKAICNETLPAGFVCSAAEGCVVNDCTAAGSSLSYSTPSLCGDSVPGIGEVGMCEYRTGEFNPAIVLGQNPVQVVTAVGQGQVNPATNLQETLVEARAVSVQRSATQRDTIDVVGQANYGLQCGYTEYAQPRIISGQTQYNDCPNNTNNAAGVGYNSCCYQRPPRTREYPPDGEGLGGTRGVCLNTLLEVSFAGDIETASVENNALLAQGFPTVVNCAQLGSTDMTNMVTGTIALRSDSSEGGMMLRRLWDAARRFFGILFGRDVFASNAQPAIATWCSTNISLTPHVRHDSVNGQVITTTIRLAMNGVLQENTVYAVILRGGVQGIHDVRGVGILPERSDGINDSWIFRTDAPGRVCKVDHVTITPRSHTFSIPNTSTLFSANIFDREGAPLQSIPTVYEWALSWGPANHPVFAIPSSGPSSTQDIQIGSRTLEGKASGFVNLTITTDAIAIDRQATGTAFTGTTNLRALFCENLWPSRQYYPYEDGFLRGAGPNTDGYNSSTQQFDGSAIPPAIINGQTTYFHFGTGYCADAGRPGTTTDDLPYLRPLVFTNTPAQAPGGGVSTPQMAPLALVQDGRPGNPRLSNPSDIVVRGNRAYVLSRDGDALMIFDITDRTNPQLISQVTGGGGAAANMFQPNALSVSGNFAYVIANGTGQGGFQVIDISDERNPRIRGSVAHSRTGQPHLWGARDIMVVGNYAYVTVSGFELRSNGLEIWDIQDADRPRPVGYINHQAGVNQLYGARGLFVSGNYAYVTATGFGIDAVQIIDISDPTNPRAAGSIQHTATAPLVGPQEIFVRGNTAYVAVSGQPRAGLALVALPVNALSMLDVSDPNNIRPLGSISHDGGRNVLLDGANNVVVTNNIAYVTAAASQAVTAIDVTDPANPVHLDSISRNPARNIMLDDLNGLWVDNTTVFTVSGRSSSFEIFDASALRTRTGAGGGAASLPAEVHKRFLFTNNRNDDVIGIQILANPKRQTARKWFEARHGVPTDFQDVEIDGLDGIMDGSNLYVNFLNQGVTPNDVQNFILLLSINPDAAPSTRRVYDQLVDNLEFLINVEDVGYCSVGNNTDPQNIYRPDANASIVCRTDFECLNVAGTDRLCANARTKLMRDWRRIAGISVIQDRLEVASSSGRYPDLRSGTYYQNYTNSRWPSWNQTLSSRLGVPQLPQDPINNWVGCTARDQQTCWDVVSTTFFCPPYKSIYEYSVSPDGRSYTVHVPFEYFVGTAGVISELLDTRHLSFTPWCVASTTYSPIRRECGDGIVNTTMGQNNEPPETCDPPGSVQVRADVFGLCTSNQSVQETCSAACTWTQQQCVNVATCGNGIVESGEVCDDGQLNGRYGQCAGANSEPTVLRCQGRHLARCGDGVRNFVDTNPADGFKDSGTADEEFCEVADTQFTSQGFCQKRSCLDPRYVVTAHDSTGVPLVIHGIDIVDVNTLWHAGHVTTGPQRGAAIYRYFGTGWGSRYNNPVPGSTLWDIFFFDSQYGWAVGYLNNDVLIVRTSDGGNTWNQTIIPLPTLPNVTFAKVVFTSQTRGVIVAAGGHVLTTTDGGVRWNMQQITTQNLTDVSFVNDQRGWVVGNSGEIFTTADGGNTWTSQEGNIAAAYPQVNTLSFTGVSFVNPSVGYVVARQDRVFKTTNGGSSWTQVTVNPAAANSLEGIRFIDEFTGFIIDQRGEVYATGNGGLTWIVQGSNLGFLQDIDMLPDGSAGLVGAQSMRAAVLRPDLYCQGATRCTSNDRANTGYACRYNDDCVSLGDGTYTFERGRSCAASCREVGGYCGDGIVNAQYEECEPTDQNCSQYCLRQNRPQPTVQTTTATCGNGRIDAGEQCDTGTQNGQACTPQYGQTCTYCSSSCVTLTRDPVSFCGDGILQREQGEICDIGPSATTSIAWDGQRNRVVTLACSGGSNPNDRRGQYSCQNNCRSIQSTCTVCGIIEQCSCVNGVDTQNRNFCRGGIDDDGDGNIDCADTSGGGANPVYAVLNPTMGSTAFSGYNQNSWGANTFADILRPRLGNLPLYDGTTQGWLGYRIFGGRNYPDFRRVMSAFAADRGGGPLINNVFINTNLLCRDAYYLDINSRFIADGQARANEPANLFPLQVNGEAGVVRNELIVSPPVPPRVFRVVVRWGSEEFNANAHFLGKLYADTFSRQNARIIDLTRAITTRNLCQDISQQNIVTGFANGATTVAPYWWPNGCTPFDTVGYVHPEIATSSLFANTYVQAMTVDLRATTTNMAFFVDEISGPIRAYESSALTVEVYTAHAGQHTLLSHYLPTHTFQIRDAAGTSSNPLSEYWHVFNFEYNAQLNRYAVVPVQSIERDILDVIANM